MGFRKTEPIPEWMPFNKESVRREIYDSLSSAGYYFHAGQRALLEHWSPRMLVIAGRRGGKSDGAARYQCIHDIWLSGERKHKDVRTFVVTPEQSHARETFRYIREFADFFQIERQDRLRDSRNPRFVLGDVLMEPRTATNPKAIKGAGITGVLVDEFSEIDYYDIIGPLMPALAGRRGHLIAISSPRGYDSWIQEWERMGCRIESEPWCGVPKTPAEALEKAESCVKVSRSPARDGLAEGYYTVVQYPTWVNPHFPLDVLRTEMPPYKPEAHFLQEYAGVVVREFGKAFPSSPIFVSDGAFDWHESQGWTWAIGADWGFADPFCALWVCKDPRGDYWVVREIYEAHLEPSAQGERIRQLQASIPVYASNGAFIVTGADSFKRDGRKPYGDYWRERTGLPVLKTGIKRLEGINLVREALRSNPAPRLRIVRERCPNLCAELETATVNPRNSEDVLSPLHAISALFHALSRLLGASSHRAFDALGEEEQRHWFKARQSEAKIIW